MFLMNGISKNWYLKSYQSLLLKYIYELIRKLTIKSLKGDFTLRNFQWTVTTGVSISIKYVFTIQVSCIPNFILLALLPDIFKVGVGVDGISDTRVSTNLENLEYLENTWNFMTPMENPWN